VPLVINWCCAPVAVLGNGIDWTSVPDGVYSSTNTGLPVLASAAPPSPTR
jgi:hypothetical protein